MKLSYSRADKVYFQEYQAPPRPCPNRRLQTALYFFAASDASVWAQRRRRRSHSSTSWAQIPYKRYQERPSRLRFDSGRDPAMICYDRGKQGGRRARAAALPKHRLKTALVI